MRTSNIRPVAVALLLVLSASATYCRRTEAASARAGHVVPQATVPYDVSLTDTARVLAGMKPEQAERFRDALTTPAWQSWQKDADADWAQERVSRLAPIGNWQQEHLAKLPGITATTLVYPFAGPDILNAVLLFPDSPRYVLFGLEHVGSLPAIDRLPADRLARLLDEIHAATADLLQRNYFITSHMSRDTQAQELHGIFPLLAVFLARLDARIVSARLLEIAPDASLRPPTGASDEGKKSASAVEIVFVRPGHAPQTVVYFRAQAEDAAIGKRPGVVPFLEREGPFLTFLKSASYLLHGPQFTKVRRLLLAQSQLILQDDSGIPVRFLPTPGWSLTLFGRYQKPVKDFNYGYQPDLARAYESETVQPLTFSFGYHWAAGSSTLMLATRTVQPADTK